MQLFKLFQFYSNHFFISHSISDLEILAKRVSVLYAVVHALFFQVLGWLPAAALLAACYRRNPSPSFSLQVQSPPPPFIPADCKRGFSPLDEKRSKQVVGSPWSDLQRRKEK